jgi:alpha-tubulin suppressor-like RCC1 family protein
MRRRVLRVCLVGISVLISVAARGQTLQQALDATNLTWTTSGLGWFPESTTKHDGVSAAASAGLSGTATATLQTTVTGPGTLTFWIYTPSSSGKVSFIIGSVTQAVYSIDSSDSYSSWLQQTVYIGAGAQTLTWTYSLSGGPTATAAYLDQVSWTTGATAPSITKQPFFNQSAPLGANATFFVAAAGTPPLSYQWQLNGTNFFRTTNSFFTTFSGQASSFTITNVRATNYGNYSVIITNSVGTNSSSSASLERGEIAVWGANWDVTGDNRGMAPPGATNVSEVSGGYYHNVAVKRDHTILSWGASFEAQPNVAANYSNAVAVAADEFSSVVLDTNGFLSAWGPSTGPTNIPGGIRNAGKIVLVAQGCAANYGLALDSSSIVYGWGSSLPSIPQSLFGAVSAAAGGYHSVFLGQNGRVAAYGDNSFGQTNVPANLTNAMAIAAGDYHSVALKTNGTVVAWGQNLNGQTNVPVGLTNVVAIAAGSYFSMALRANGTVVVWGSSSLGVTNVPAYLTNVIAIAAGGATCLAVVGSSPPTWTALAGNATFTTNIFRASIPSQGGRIYELEYKNSLKDTNWTGWINGLPVLPLVAGNGTNVVLKDSSATNSTRFYRVRKW